MEDLRRLRVLVVSDNPAAARQLARLAGEADPGRVEVCFSAGDAFKATLRGEVDVVLLDCDSTANAEALLRGLGKLEPAGKIQVAALTTDLRGITVNRLKNWGAAAVLAKPVNRKLLEKFLLDMTANVPGAPTTPEDIENRLKTIDRLAPLPALVGQVLAVAGDPDSTARDLSGIIQADQSLTAKILQIVNSAYYGFYREIGNIDHAVVILGFDEVVNLTLAACLIQTFRDDHDPRFDLGQFWLHSLAAAHIAKALRAYIPEVIPKDAFVVGLLHDLGKVVLYQYFRDLFLKGVTAAAQANRRLNDASAELGVPDHAEVGAKVADAWNLPRPLVKAIRLHHQPERAESQDWTVHLAHLANFFAHLRHIGASGNPVPDAPHPASLKLFGFDTQDLDSVWLSLNVDVEGIQAMLHTLTVVS